LLVGDAVRTAFVDGFHAHAELIEHTMSLLRHFVQVHQSTSEDVRTVQLLGIRLFNSAASVWKLLLSGYYQTSMLQQRDLLETIFLLDYFRTNQSLIAEWRNSTDEIRYEEFRPSVVRKALDKRDGFTTRKRGDSYKMFCELGAHPTYLGFHMLTDKPGGDIHTGPFFDSKSLKAGIEELARHLALAGGVFINLFLKSLRTSEHASPLLRNKAHGLSGSWADHLIVPQSPDCGKEGKASAQG
jgi:hypothetical protein